MITDELPICVMKNYTKVSGYGGKVFAGGGRRLRTRRQLSETADINSEHLKTCGNW